MSGDDTFDRLAVVFAQSARSPASETAVQWRIVWITCVTALSGGSSDAAKRTLQLLPNLQLFIARHASVLTYQHPDGDAELEIYARVPFALWLVAFLLKVQAGADGSSADVLWLHEGIRKTIDSLLKILCCTLIGEGGVELARTIWQELNLLGDAVVKCDAQESVFEHTLFHEQAQQIPTEIASSQQVLAAFNLSSKTGRAIVHFRENLMETLAGLRPPSPQMISLAEESAKTCHRYISEMTKTLTNPKGKSTLGVAHIECMLRLITLTLKSSQTQSSAQNCLKNMIKFLKYAAENDGPDSVVEEALSRLADSTVSPAGLINVQDVDTIFRSCASGDLLSRLQKRISKETTSHPLIDGLTNSRKRKRSGQLANETPKASWHLQVRQVLAKYASDFRVNGSDSFDKTFADLIEHFRDNATDSPTLADAVGLLACARAGQISTDESGCLLCAACDGQTDDQTMARCLTEMPLTAIVNFVNSTSDTKKQVEALTALTRIIRHCRSTEASLALGPANPVTRTVKQLISSPKRNVRRSAGYVLANLAAAVISLSPITAQNILLPDLAVLTATAKFAVRETAMATLAKLSLFLTDDLLCQALLPMVLQLGPRSDAISSLAYSSLYSIAEAREVTPYQLFAPSMFDLGSAIAAHPKRHHILPAFTKLIGMEEAAFFSQNVASMLPVALVRGSVEEVADLAKRSGSGMLDLVLSALTSTLATLCFLPQKEYERGVATLLATFETPHTIEFLLSTCVGEVLFEVCLARNAPSVMLETALSRVDKACGGHSVQKLLNTHALAIISHANDFLTDARGKKTLTQKRAAILGLGNLIAKIGPSIADVTPQIMATLQSTLRAPLLREVTLRSWHRFVTTLDHQNVFPLIGQTSAAFAQLWPDFNPAERHLARQMLQYMLDSHEQQSTLKLSDVADLSDLPGLEVIADRLLKHQAGLSLRERISNLVQRVESENEYVCLRALRDLQKSLISDAATLHKLTAGDTFDPAIADILRSVTLAAIRGGESSAQVRQQAFGCLGALGAADPDRLDLPPEDSPFVMTHDFNEHTEAMHFAAYLMNRALVDAYRSSNDTKHQAGLAYAIQELLKFCQFTPALISANAQATVISSIRRRWAELPKATIEIVSPLLTSRFVVYSGLQSGAPQRPIYPTVTAYRDWARIWTVDMISQVQKRDAKAIFQAFAGVVKQGDVVVSRKLIPHLVLHLFLADAGANVDRHATYTHHIVAEILQVLTDQTLPNPTPKMHPDSRLLCAQTVFDVLDHLNQWSRKQTAEWTKKRHRARKVGQKQAEGQEVAMQNIDAVQRALREIPHDLQARAAFKCSANARALLNFEIRASSMESKSMHNAGETFNEYCELIHQIYAALDEPDGMEGVSTKIVHPDLWHQIREHESTGRWTAAQSCWEIKLQNEPDNPASHVGLLKCLRNLGHYDSMRIHIHGVLASHADWLPQFLPFQAECALIIGDWEGVAAAVKAGEGDSSPELTFARVIQAMRSNQTGHQEVLQSAQEFLGNKLLAAGQESYRRSYDIAANLHALHEIELIFKSSHSAEASAQASLGLELDARLAMASPSFRIREFLLNLRRTAFRMLNPADTRIGPTWLEVAKVARKAGHTQTAYSAILQAVELRTPMSFKEAVKLEKVSGQADHALQTLQIQLNACLPRELSLSADGPVPYDRALAKTLVLEAKWMIEAERFDRASILGTCRTATRLAPDWEGPSFILGHYFDGIQKDLYDKTEMQQQHRTAMYSVIRYFTRTLALGTKYIYQALPRVLTLYVQFGEFQDRAAAAAPTAKAQRRRSGHGTASTTASITANGSFLPVVDADKEFVLATKYVRRAVAQLPPWQWLTAYPQIVSRICQTNKTVQEVLEEIMLVVLQNYPHHAIWAMISVAKSTVVRRASRATAIFNQAKANSVKQGTEIGRLIPIGEALVVQLLHLCNYDLKDKEELKMNIHMTGLVRLAPCPLIIPLQSSLTVTLPPSTLSTSTHRPFPLNLPTWTKFDNDIDIMSSLIRPRKITVYSDDGRAHSFLCKPKDDLRKDARLMEFNSIINKLLKKDSESRKRHLHIRTYAVVPLNEECGIIEWVPNTVGFRHILVRLYESRGISPWSGPVKTVYETIRGNDPAKPDDKAVIGHRFSTRVLPSYPPVFREWFLDSFPEPSTWLKNRLAYTRTAAVISMVGFVLGLGDRHGENILLDSTNGDTVHVDFNCLFDKGRGFDVPEQVPFRLTQNVVDGMGITGPEGVFRRASEVTMTILRTNQDSLMSVLETFVHDPLVEWGKKRKKGAVDPGADDHQTTQARKALDPIKLKLKGLRISSDPLEVKPDRASTVGNQVESLISEAKSPGNLGSMYVGWCAHF